MQKFADEEIFRRLRDEITSGEKLGFKVKYDGEDLVLEKEKGLLFLDKKAVCCFLQHHA